MPSRTAGGVDGGRCQLGVSPHTTLPAASLRISRSGSSVSFRFPLFGHRAQLAQQSGVFRRTAAD